jgi:hypothetical protein
MSIYGKDEELKPFSYQPYQKSDAVRRAEELLRQHTSRQPSAYQSRYQADMDSLMSKIQNRQPFQYNVNADALYQQYKNSYIHNGQRAMQDTMGQAAALTGGYGSSYAQSVGQQAYNEYMTGLNDVIPELYQMALDKYDRDTDRLWDQYSVYADLDARDYSRHQDEQNAYYSQLDRLREDARYEAEQDYGRYASNYEAAYAQYQKDVEAARENADKNGNPDSDADAPLDKAIYARTDDEGNNRYYLGGKEVTFAQGINPHTGTINPDVKHGTFGPSGYQPSHITINKKEQKLTKTGITDKINGHEQNVWRAEDGSLWMWDDTKNAYTKYSGWKIGNIVNTRNIDKFKQSIMPREAYGNPTESDTGYKSYIREQIEKADSYLTEDEVYTLMKFYGFIE